MKNNIFKSAFLMMAVLALMIPTIAQSGPSVKITSPQEGSSVSGVVTVQADIAGDAQEVSATLRNGESGKTVFSDKTGAGRYTIAIDTLANREADKFESGNYYLSVQARDSGGTLGYDQVVVNVTNGRYTASTRTQPVSAPAPTPTPEPAVEEAAPVAE